MKLILLAIFCSGIALGRIEEWNWLDEVSPNRKIEDSAFRSGREYQFFYNAQLTTGIAGSSKQHSANRIQAVVTVGFKSQNHVLLKLQNIRMGKLNRDISNPRKIMPFDAFEDVQIEQHLKQKLERPVKFSYNGGLVHDVVFDSQENPWSANIKRGVLNLLQVNLQQQRRLDMAEEARLTNGQRFNNENTQFYRVMEKTLEGECETEYTILELPSQRRSNQPILNVTKSINFENCKKRPQIKYNFRFADDCPSCESKYNDDEKFLKSSTVAKYVINGDKQTFLIDTARIDSEYVFVPFNEEANAIVTYVNQTLVLVKSGPAQSLSEPQNPIQSDSDMVFTLDWDAAYEKFHMKGDSQHHRQLHESQQGQNKVELAKKFVQKIVEKMREQLDEDVPHYFTRLTQLMRMCQEEELHQIVNVQERSGTPEHEKKLKNVIPQALGACGTKHCTKLLVQKIRQGQITPLRGIIALKGLLHNRVVSQEIIEEVKQLAESEKAQENERLKRNAWLTVGSLINALCTENDDQLAIETKENTMKLCPRELKEKYVKELFNKLRQSNKWQDKVLMLKTIGNAGLDSSVTELEKIIRQQDQPTHLRFEAIQALHQMADTVPKTIQRILMPIIMNRQDNSVVRSAASHILLHTKPERPLLDQLAHNLVNEPSRQFAAFLYTQMEQYANSTNPCEKKLATDMKLALRHSKKPQSGLGYSRSFHTTAHDEEQQLGIDTDARAIYSNISPIPRQLSYSIHVNALGFWQKYLASVQLFNEGLEPLARQFLNEDAGDFWTDMSDALQQSWNNHPRSTRNTNKNQYQQELEDIFSNKLKIRSRDYSQEYGNEPKAYFTTTYKGQSVGLFPITKEFIQQLIQDAGSNLRQVEQKLRQGLQVDYATVAELHDMQYKVPTTIGMPLTVTIKAPVAWSLKGNLRATVGSSSQKSIQVQAQLKPSAVAQLTCKVEAWSPIVNSGIKIKAKAKLFTPIDARLEIDLGTKPIQIKASIKPPTQKRDLLVLETRPVTYTQDWQRYIRSTEEGQEERTIMGEEQNRVSTFNKCFGQQTLGIQMCARGQVHRTQQQRVTGTPFAPLSGPNKIVVTSEPGQNPPEEIHIKLHGKFQQLSGSEMQKPRFSHFTQQDEDDVSSASSSSSSESQQGSQERQENGRRSQSPINRRSTTHQRQQKSSNKNFRDVLQEYRNYDMKKGYKTQVQLEMQAGSNRKVQVELSHIYDIKQRYSQLNMKLQRQRPDQWEACLEAEMMFPQQPRFAEDVKDKKILSNAQLQWGHSCNSQNYIKLTTRAERSSQQKEWERRQGQYQEFSQKKCGNNKAWCSPLMQEEFVEKIGQMLKYQVDIDYQNVPLQLQNATNKVYRALKNYYYWQTDVNQFTQNQQNKIRAEIILDAQTKQRLNVTIKTPKETTKLQDLPLSRPIQGVSQKQSIREQFNDYINDDDSQAECTITPKSGTQRRAQVETFDGTKFSTPLTNCWSVLAKDCGSQQPKFVVMAKTQGRGNSETKQVKIVTRRHRIQLTPQSDEYDSVQVEVDGQTYDPENDQDIVDQSGRTVAIVDKDQGSVRVKLPQTGVDVEFDGYAINIKLSDHYRGQQCGLCGHFDYESNDEFRNPDFTEEKDLRKFYMNYLIKDGCQAPSQLNEICESEECDKDSRSSSSSSSSSSGSQEDSGSNESQEAPEHKTKVIEMDDQLCFSTVPIPQCDEEDSYPMGVKQTKQIHYVCIDQDSQSAEEIERRARYGSTREIAELKNRTPSFTRTETIPEKCKKYGRY